VLKQVYFDTYIKFCWSDWVLFGQD